MSKAGSFTDIAFETGVIAERERIINLLRSEGKPTVTEQQLEQIEKRIEAAKNHGRQIEREYIDAVLGVCIDTAITDDQRKGLKLARDMIRGLPHGNL